MSGDNHYLTLFLLFFDIAFYFIIKCETAEPPSDNWYLLKYCYKRYAMGAPEQITFLLVSKTIITNL
jgi:hypothetical protein